MPLTDKSNATPKPQRHARYEPVPMQHEHISTDARIHKFGNLKKTEDIVMTRTG